MKIPFPFSDSKTISDELLGDVDATLSNQHRASGVIHGVQDQSHELSIPRVEKSRSFSHERVTQPYVTRITLFKLNQGMILKTKGLLT